MAMFRVRPYDDYTTDSGAPLDNVLRQEIERQPDRIAAAITVIMCRMHEAGTLSNDDVLSVLNTSREYFRGQWEVVE